MKIDLNGKMTRADVREALKTTWVNRENIIEFNGQRIGRYVSYGDRNTMNRKKITTKYGSRIFIDGLRIEEEAISVSSLLNKVAAKIHAYAKENKLSITASQQNMQPDFADLDTHTEEYDYTGPKM